MNVNKILVLIAVILFVLAAFGVTSFGGVVATLALGLAFWASASLVT